MGRTKRIRINKRKEPKQQGDSETKTHIDLCQYMSSCGWKNDTKLKIRQFDRTGRGVYSSKAIKEGYTFIDVPFASLISLQTLEEDEGFINLFVNLPQEVETKISFQSLLSLYVLYHQSLCDESPISGYIKTIPKKFTNPAFCTKNELFSLPESLLEILVEQLKGIKNEFAILSSMLCEAFDFFTLEAFKWATFVTNSRSVFVDAACVKVIVGKDRFFERLLRDRPSCALAPFMDLINHSDKVTTNSSLSLTHMEISKALKAGKDLKDLTYRLSTGNSFQKNRQIFISYGILDNTKLLIEYGFYLNNNQHDRFYISMQDFTNFIKHYIELREMYIDRKKFQFIKDHSVDREMFFTIDGPSHNLLVVLQILFVEQTHFSNLLNQVAFGDCPDIEIVKQFGKKLVEFKVNEYQKLVNRFKDTEDKCSDCGFVCVGYIYECIKLLKIAGEKFQ